MPYVEAAYMAESSRENMQDEACMRFHYLVCDFFAANALLDNNRNYIPRVINRYINIYGSTNIDVKSMYDRLSKIKQRRK